MNTYSLYDLFPAKTNDGQGNLTGTLDARGVRVPAIQREYVQGRSDANGAKVRANFIPALLQAAQSKDVKTLHYVYGSINDGMFKPLDGQQRLTTLYLLAWVCGVVEKNWIFEYESRRVAQFFMRGLRNLSFRIADGITPRDCILQTDWYLPIWDEDPSVNGMMRMLDDIYKEIVSKDVHGNPKYPNKNFDISRIRFSFRNIKVEDKSYSQIYLKMNARGKPLTGWEKLKAILDSYVPDSLMAEWKKKVDGCWSEGIWDLLAFAKYDARSVNSDEDAYDEREGELRAAYLSEVFEKVVRATSVCSLNLPYNFSLYELNDRLSIATNDTRLLFYGRCRRMMLALSDEVGIRNCWTECRAENSLWSSRCVESEEEKLSAFCSWLVARSEHSFSRLARLLLLSTYFCGGCEKRKIRTVLNALDATNIDNEAKLSSMISEGELYLSESDQEIKVLKSYNEDMVKEECSKSTIDEVVVVNAEIDNLVVKGDTRFLSWKTYCSGDGLIERLERLRSLIKKDWLAFYADLLNNLEYDDKDVERTMLKEKAIIPFSEEIAWGREVFHKKQFARALSKFILSSEKRDYPLWVRHLASIVRDGKLGENRAIKYTHDWMFVIPTEKLSPYAIRLDRSEIEAINRSKLKGGVILFGGKDSRWLPRESNVSGEYYRVWDKNWYASKDPLPCDKDGNLLQNGKSGESDGIEK